MAEAGPPGEIMERRVSPVGTPDPPPASTTDVAPTREGRRRPREHTPSPEPQLSPGPSPEVRPTQALADSSGGWGYWGSWGKTLLSTATATVNTVGQGLTQVMEKAETSLGLPSPAELSSQVQKEERQTEARGEPDGENTEGPSAVAMGMLSSLSSVVQRSSKTVLSGGLDALEFLGKKTMDVIAEGDPGFRKTKGLMIRPSTLSQVLREAKEEEEEQGPGGPGVAGGPGGAGGPGPEGRRTAHYGRLFDEFHGLAHLEALEALSRESQAKVGSVLATVSGEQLVDLREQLDRIKDAFTLEELDDDELDDKQDLEFEKELTEALARLEISSAERLGAACRRAGQQLAEMSTTEEEVKQEETKQEGEQEGEQEEKEEKKEEEDVSQRFSVEEVHTAAIRSLAEVTAHSIQQLLRAGEKTLLCLPEQEGQSSALEQSSALAQVTLVLCKEISLLAKKFTSCLTSTGANEKGEVLNPLITGVFLEASNSASYLQDAFQLLLPVLQISHIQRTSGAGQP
ncbi:protein FAM114A2 [Gadus morhua]|uniref:protein FAM114A2 n=1 Tax=Gadus morhua TaxID=8049 RepID=UPI0011B7C12F|nr:protein FAM114A2 [Gadus morhua]